MGLFDKKFCDVCGEKIGLLGNRKLEDGNLCKSCAGKLSPWFSDRRSSTVAAIKEQLAYREENKTAVAGFGPSKTFGDDWKKLFADEAAGTFTICSDSDLKGGNPDILRLSQVKDCRVEPVEHRTERKYKDKEGKLVSYTPPQYDYSYDFACTVTVEHPYFDEMSFNLNANEVEVRSTVVKSVLGTPYRVYEDMGNEVTALLLGKETPAPEKIISGREALPFAYYDPNAQCSICAYVDVLYHCSSPLSEEETRSDMKLCLQLASEACLSYGLARLLAEPEIMQKAAEAQLAKTDYPFTKLKLTRFKLGEETLTLMKEKGIDPEHLVQLTSEETAALIKARAAASGMELKAFADSQIAAGEASAAAAAETAAETVTETAPETSAASAADGSWTCPVCQGTGNTGKFCEYCGSPRA